MSIRKRKDGYWIVDFRDEQGRNRSRSCGKGREGKKKAQKLDTEIAYKLAHEEPLPASRAEGIYLDDLSQLWVDAKKAQGRKTRWLAEWAHVFNKYFSSTLATKPAHMVTEADVLSVVSAHFASRSQATRNRYIGYLKSTFQFGVDRGYISKNPLHAWKSGKETSRMSKLTFKDFQTILAVAPEHLAWALEVAWNIPVRPGASDLYALRFDTNVDYNRGGVNVVHSKVGRMAFVQCNTSFMRKLHTRESLHQSGYLVEYKGRQVKRLDTALQTAAKKAKLSYTPCMYDVRHLWITTMLDAGLEPSAIAYLAGTSVEMVHKNYYEPHQAERGRAAELLPQVGKMTEPGKKVVGIEDARNFKMP